MPAFPSHPLPANMRRAAAKGFINATDCADYLTKKGMPFRDAYKCTGTTSRAASSGRQRNERSLSLMTAARARTSLRM